MFISRNQQGFFEELHRLMKCNCITLSLDRFKYGRIIFYDIDTYQMVFWFNSFITFNILFQKPLINWNIIIALFKLWVISELNWFITTIFQRGLPMKRSKLFDKPIIQDHRTCIRKKCNIAGILIILFFVTIIYFCSLLI